MTNKSKARGTAWETRAGRYLGLRRLPLAGNKDLGDLDCDIAVVECKNTKVFDLAGWMDELDVEMRNAEKGYGFVIFPRRNYKVGKSYCLMPLDQLNEILELIRRA